MEKIPSRDIEYTPDFKAMIANNPGALKSFLKLEKEIEGLDPEDEQTFQDGDVTVTPLYKVFKRIGVFREELDDYLKVDIGEESFFVKRINGLNDAGGVTELKSLEMAKSILIDIPKVKVIDFKLGYQDNRSGSGKTYFVTKWMDLPTLGEYMDNDGTHLLYRYEEICKRLEDQGFDDVHENNMLYDESTDMIYVFDVFHASLIKQG